MHRQRAELLKTFGDGGAEKAEKAYLRAIEVARWQKARTLELRAAMGLSHLLQSRDRLREAHELLAPVCEALTDSRDDPEVTEAREFLRTTN
jgi:hypothetical protein